MAKFYVDYSTYVVIDAETAEEAEKIFWQGKLFWQDEYGKINCPEFQIDGIEEVEDD